MQRCFLAFGCWALVFGAVARAEDTPSKEFPWERIPEIKVSDFRADFLSRVAKVLGEIRSYGRCADSVAACLGKDTPHATAARLARDVFLLMAESQGADQINKWIDARKKMAHPDRMGSFNLEGLVVLGKKEAPVVIVTFSDFQCPYCAKLAPMLEEVVRESDGKARLYFKQFPVKGHARALEAAKACVASDAFGKFWEYCGKLYRYRTDLSDENLLGLARRCGIDPKKFKEEMERDGVLNRIADEKMEGLKNRIQGTPAVFINGKEVLSPLTASLLRDRIEEELDILQGRD